MNIIIIHNCRRYLPVLKNYPTRYLHEPWTAPESIQKSAKCIIGVDYPKPMVNHAFVSRINMERMKQVYNQLNLYRQNGQVPRSFIQKSRYRTPLTPLRFRSTNVSPYL